MNKNITSWKKCAIVALFFLIPAGAVAAPLTPSGGVQPGQIQLAQLDAVETMPWDQVGVLVSNPSTSFNNKPFIVIYRFRGPVSGFNRGLIRIENGKLNYFAGNQAGTVYRILVVPDAGLYQNNSPRVRVVLDGSANGSVIRDVKIVAPRGSSDKQDTAEPPEKDFRFFTYFVSSRGGDVVNTAGTKAGDNVGFQIGLSYSVLNGTARFQFGARQMANISDQTSLQAPNVDLLYEIPLNRRVKLIGGVTYVFAPSIKSKFLQMEKIYTGTWDAKVNFKDSYGAKFMIEYGLFVGNVGLYISGGFTVLNYELKEIEFKNSVMRELINSNTLSASSLQLGIGLHY